MFFISSNFLLLMEVLIFLTVVLLHMVKKEAHTIYIYMVQSVLTVTMLGSLLLNKISVLLIVAILLTFVVKVILVPIFFFKIIKKYNLIFSINNYLNVPITLLLITIITAVARSNLFEPILSKLSVLATEQMLSLAVANILISLFLIVNRRGALSQIFGILSLENGIVVFSSISGLEQSPGIQIAIIFNIFIWILIATIFTSMLFKHFGSISLDKLNSLKE